MAEATAKAYNVIESVEWDVDDPNVLTASLGSDGRSVFFRVNQRSEEFPRRTASRRAKWRRSSSTGKTEGTRPRARRNRDPASWIRWESLTRTRPRWRLPGSPKSSRRGRTRSGSSGRWKPPATAPPVAGQTVYDYLTSFDPGFIDSKGQPVTQYTYKLALFKANKFNLEN